MLELKMSASDSNFYTSLPLMHDFFEVSDPGNFHALPGDWYVAVTDIVNSTAAIENGAYKTVNILGAAPIVGMLNHTGQGTIPYVFGGDGAAFCVPKHLATEARRVLAESRKIGKSAFDLDLRAALIPVKYLKENGYELSIARYKASENYVQAIFSGGGLEFADRLLKSDRSEIKAFRISMAEQNDSVDFSGLECRWQEVPQPSKEVITLLVQANPEHPHPEQVYRGVLQEMRRIFGFDKASNPINAAQLQMHLSYSKLGPEAAFHSAGKGWLKRLGYLLKMQIQVLAGKLFMALGYRSSVTDWSLYKSDLASNCDYRKFDDMLRVVISSDQKQQAKLMDFLENQYEQEALAYGLHTSQSAIITCMVFQYHREHVHFVDGSGGGYVAASKELKKRLSRLENRESSKP